MLRIRTTASIIAGSLAAIMMMHHAHGSDLPEPAEDLDGTSEVLEFPQIVTLQGWRYDELYLRSTSADELIDDVAVFGASGEQIGYTEDLIMGVEGEVLALIAEIGGFWDIGDTHVSIPWRVVELGPDGVTIPMTEDTINEYEQVPPSPLEATAVEGTVQAGVEGLITGPRAWRATELIGDSVRIRDADIPAVFGYVNDFLIQDGRIAATVVAISQADREPEYRAYPPLGYEKGFTPESEYYDLPYSQEELDRIHPFDYERLVDQ